MNAEDLLRFQPSDMRSELVRGRMIVREPPGFRHGAISARVAALVGAHVNQHGLGVVVVESGFTLARNPDTVRSADVAFLRLDRVPHPLPAAYGELAPDLVLEVLSPDARAAATLAKVDDWLKAGTRLVWIVDPERRNARVYRTTGPETMIGPGGTLDGEDVLRGFACPLEALW